MKKTSHLYKSGEVSEDDAVIDLAVSSNDGQNLPPLLTRLGLSAESFRRRPATSNGGNQLNQTMKMRHLHMIAIGGSIGAGFFVGSGDALATGGPGSVLIDFCLIGIMMFNVAYALGELAVMYPVSGAFYSYCSRFIDPSLGFAIGWNYIFQWAIVLPLEICVAGLTVQYWNGGKEVNIAVWMTVFFVAIVVLNIFGVLGYAEEEFWAASLKLVSVIIFMVVAVVLIFGGAPANKGPCGPDGCYREFWGARYWRDPGAFRNGFKGLCSVFIMAAFSFSGCEMVGLAAAESANPTKHLPGAIKQVFWRVTLFYVVGLSLVGLLVPYNDKRLLGSGELTNIAASPFVIVAKNAGLDGLDSFLNVVILVSVISIGMAGIYGGSRTLTALAEQGYAPKCFAYVDIAGRPLWSTVFILSFGFIAYLGVASGATTVFAWLQAACGLATLLTWGSICLAHIRFRKAWKYQGRSLDEIPFKAPAGTIGSWIGLIIVSVVIIAQIYVAIFPIETPGAPMSSAKRAEVFFRSCLTLPVCLGFWALGHLWKKAGWIRIQDIDLDTGRREHDWNAIKAERERIAQKGVFMRALHVLF